MEKLRLEDVKQGKQTTVCCYIWFFFLSLGLNKKMKEISSWYKSNKVNDILIK